MTHLQITRNKLNSKFADILII